MSETKYRAAKYIRLSYADDKDGESNSVENQRKQIDSFIANQPDIEVVSEKVDDGVSGIIFDRKAFKEMMEEIEAGEINCVIVKDLSRFGREYIETGRYLRRIFPAYGVRFIAINDNIDTIRDSADDLVVGVKSIINDAYSRDISVKTRSALEVKRNNGDYVGACPIYGYRRSEERKNQLIIDEYPASIVQEIFRMKIDGMSASKIAEILNQQGVLSPMAYKRDRGLPHPTGGFADKAEVKWSATAILRILSDETYTGTLIQGRKKTLNYKIKEIINVPETEWKRTADAHDGIVSKQDFDLVRRIMRLDTRSAPGGDKVYLFSGVLICGCCGGRMTRKTNRYKDRTYHYYYCPVGKKNGCTSMAMIREEDMIRLVLESIEAHLRNIASLKAVMAEIDRRTAAQAIVQKYQNQIAEIEKQLEQVAKFKASLYENLVSGLLTKDDYRMLKVRYTEDENRLHEAIRDLETDKQEVLNGKAERMKWAERFAEFTGLDVLDRRMVITLIQSIRVFNKTNVEITFNYQDEYEQDLTLKAITTSDKEVS